MNSQVPERRSRKRGFIALVCIWVLLIIGGSLLPTSAKQWLRLDQSPQHKGRRIKAWHRVAHYAAFGSTAVILLLLARNAKQEIAAVSAAIVLGLGLEIAEFSVYPTTFEYRDVCDDSIAAIGAYAVFKLARSSAAGRSES